MGQRPQHVKPPAYLSPNPPVPQPEPVSGPLPEGRSEQQRASDAPPTDDPLGRDPTRYGDWELKGIAVDF